MRKAVLLFSNSLEIQIVTSLLRTKDLELNDINNDTWLKYFSEATRRFIPVNKDTSFSEKAILVSYDGKCNETDDLQLDQDKIKQLSLINSRFDKIHIAFHKMPSEKNKDEIRRIIQNISSEEFPLPHHNHPQDNHIYSEVYNAIANLYYDNRGNLRTATNTTQFFNQNVHSIEDIVKIVFVRAESMKLETQMIKFLFCCMSAELIKINKNITNDLSIFPVEYRNKIQAILNYLSVNYYQDAGYQDQLQDLTFLINQITRNNPIVLNDKY